MEFDESDAYYQPDYDEDWDGDIYYPMGFCGDEDCLMWGNHHFSYECHTAEDLTAYYKTLEEENTEPKGI